LGQDIQLREEPDVLPLRRDAETDDLLAPVRGAFRGADPGRAHSHKEPLRVCGQQVPLMDQEWIQVRRRKRPVETGHVFVDAAYQIRAQSPARMAVRR